MSSNTKKLTRGFTLVEIMVVVAIIALLAVIAIPNTIRARKRAQASRILEDLRLIDAAKDQYALEYNKPGNAVLVWSQVQLYLKPNSGLYDSGGKDLFGHAFEIGAPDTSTLAHDETYAEFNDLNLPSDFWGGFNK